MCTFNAYQVSINHQQYAIINYNPQINNKSTTYLNFELLGFLQDVNIFQFFKESPNLAKVS